MKSSKGPFKMVSPLDAASSKQVKSPMALSTMFISPHQKLSQHRYMNNPSLSGRAGMDTLLTGSTTGTDAQLDYQRTVSSMGVQGSFGALNPTIGF